MLTGCLLDIDIDICQACFTVMRTYISMFVFDFTFIRDEDTELCSPSFSKNNKIVKIITLYLYIYLYMFSR